ncbi:redoxin domain-containing protein [Candidatus Woesearchaeota archaeon]|nr:redoxin domain-containing protein [Candidatus Woesearchaeota archaeon]
MNSEKLLLLDIFSYSCMNCVRSLEYIKKLGNKYKKYGLKTIIVHVPEWDFEKNKSNIHSQVKSQKISFQVKNDSNKKLIKKLKVNFWPSQLLLKNNKVVYKHIGEGNYRILENNIRKHLEIKKSSIFHNEPKYSEFPTVYAGKRKKGKIKEIKNNLKFGIIYVDGKYRQNEEFLEIKGSLKISTRGKIVNFVAESGNKKPVIVNIKADNRFTKNLKVNGPKLYRIAESKSTKTLELATNKNLRIYSFSFE